MQEMRAPLLLVVLEGVSMLFGLLFLASMIAGFVKAPWWFWVLAGVTMAIIAATDPGRLRVSNADVRGMDALPLLLEDLKLVSRGCLLSAVAFLAGSGLADLLVLAGF